MFSPLLQPLLQPLMRGPMEPSGRTLIQRAIAVLRRFGQDAHVYLPGVGMLNGLTAGNYLDSAGTTQGTVDQPVGLVLDAAGGLGVELAPSNFLAWSNNAATVTSNSFSGSVGTGILFGPLVVNSTYQAFVSGVVSGVVSINTADAAAPTARTLIAIGAGTVVFKADRPYFYLRSDATPSGISNLTVSVREVTGIHSSQPTTAAKPILRRDAGGRYYWQFDGSNDSLSLGGPLFQMADDHCVVAGAQSDKATGAGIVFAEAGSGTQRCAQLFFNSGVLNASWVADSSGAVPLVGPSYVGSKTVASLRKIGNDFILRSDGILRQSATIVLGATALDSYSIGSHKLTPGNFHQGAIYPVIAIKGTVSDPDLLLLEKFVGQLSGVQI